MEVLEEAASYLGTYARMVLVYQDLDQLGPSALLGHRYTVGMSARS
jgi:hypothetical protein